MSHTEISSEPVYSFSRGENEQIRLALRPYKGRYYIDLRLWFQTMPDSPFTPTKKGVSFSTDHLPELKEAIKRLDTACLNLNPGLRTLAENPENRPKIQQNSGPRRQPSPWPNRNQRKPFN